MSRIWQHDSEINSVVESCACVPEISFPDNQASPRALEGLPFLVKGADPPISLTLCFLSCRISKLFFSFVFHFEDIVWHDIDGLFLNGIRGNSIDRHCE